MEKSSNEHPVSPSASPSSSSPSGSCSEGRPSPPKRPAGRTKFQETRHPVFRGVRRRGRAGRWVCEVRVPGSRGDRLWVGTFDTAVAAARAHDAAMLALCGESASLNFADSAWLLDVPRAVSGSLPDVQLAATEAVAGFMQRHGGNGSASSGPQSMDSATSPTAAVNAETPPAVAALENGMLELDTFGGMDAGSYYASLAQGLLMEPPPTTVECPEDEGCGGAGMELWS
ncbi:dehydration-responsive element-binding protein 1J-like [Phragmites australis]|uniref:dehydration-responsive element-binding protein 1J-like n=1 Tax=Phragmites australis TaxID=29695 RepID=UPI002D79B1AB|nr:dehydration-responsive element-binding protein 1J-like [Phragmites australis]